MGGFETAKSQIGIAENVFLHAGPAFTTVDEICQPIINSAAVGAVFEGLTKNHDDAVNMVRSGEIILKPAQDHNVVTPLAAVVTPNMPLHYVYDEIMAIIIVLHQLMVVLDQRSTWTKII